ncbi:metalloregulator ArsR/SmtB family transcription factor [Sphingomonas sp. XMGL2]|uniref:Metalloregulator ArsR/SmtB family transcription factor n=2 Tax=Sphingomonas quercus TaxID=2842451 RepID=A0ABS6BLA4_9SPHN|nr:metalloregulator ArsR/SmtB family transcription factor [Sphingomonas quercus]
MNERVPLAAAFLKGLASPQRLKILCVLVEGEAHVGALIAATGISPSSMSQHLGKLKEEGIVEVRRDHRTLHYRIGHPATLAVMQLLSDHFCKDRS